MTFIRKMLLGIVLIVVFLVVVVASSDNSAPVALRFLDYGSPEWPLSWWILAAFVSGMLIGFLLTTWINFRMKIDNMRSQRELRKNKEELDKLRTMNLQ